MPLSPLATFFFWECLLMGPSWRLHPSICITSRLESKDWAAGKLFPKIKIIWIILAHISPSYLLSSCIKTGVDYQQEKISAGLYFQVPLSVFQLTIVNLLFCESINFHIFLVLPLVCASMQLSWNNKDFDTICSFSFTLQVDDHLQE